MLTRFLPRSRSALVTACVAGGLVLAGGGIATGVALAGSAQPAAAAAAAPTPSPATHAKGAHPRAAAEVVTAVTSGSVTVDTKRGAKTYTLNSATTYREGKAQVTASALQAGQKVRIRIVPGTTSDPVAQTVAIVPTQAAPASPTA